MGSRSRSRSRRVGLQFITGLFSSSTRIRVRAGVCCWIRVRVRVWRVRVRMQWLV